MNKLIAMAMLVCVGACVGEIPREEESKSSSISAMTGTWRTCKNLDDDGNGINDSSAELIYSFSNGGASQIETQFNNTGCVPSNAKSRTWRNYSYQKSGNAFSMTLSGISFSPLNESEREEANNRNFCGLTNWSISTPRNILGRSCYGGTSSFGDVENASIVVEGSTLRLNGQTNLQLSSGVNFTPRGQVLPGGAFTHSNGKTRAMYLTTNGGSYSVFHYDLVNRKYYQETGSYSSNNNKAVFTILSTTPSGCLQARSQERPFCSCVLGLNISYTDRGFTFIGLKVDYSESHYRNIVLGGGFTSGCF